MNQRLLPRARKKDKISKDDFLDAIDRTVAGLEKKSKIISPEEKKIIAYHEAGHAVVSWLLDMLIRVQKDYYEVTGACTTKKKTWQNPFIGPGKNLVAQPRKYL